MANASLSAHVEGQNMLLAAGRSKFWPNIELRFFATLLLQTLQNRGILKPISEKKGPLKILRFPWF